jgi:hypothetical protein
MKEWKEVVANIVIMQIVIAASLVERWASED